MKRWPVIRHIRYWFKAVAFNIWWDRQGRYLGAFPNQSDMDYLDAVWRGED